MYLLDTNVVSHLRRPEKADSNVLAWSTLAREPKFISVVTVLELRIGALLLDRRDPVQARAYTRWIDHTVLPQFKDHIISIDLPVTEQCARLHVPNKRPERDAFIAATALVHRLTVVTRNIRDFEGSGATLINPWAPIGSRS